jgi:hypothetical protein
LALEYCGLLDRHDPLFYFLKEEIIPPLNGHSTYLDIHVFKMEGSKQIYLYEEEHTGIKIIGKFFPSSNRQNGFGQRSWAEHEFYNLCMVRAYGLASTPHRVVKPLGFNRFLNNVLLEEYFEGVTLTDVINDALARGDFDLLYEKLTALAYFLATLHNRTANGFRVDFQRDMQYLGGLVEALLERDIISFEEGRELWERGQLWLEEPSMWEDNQVLVHGDATPGNFLFGMGLEVTAIDLERLKYADRVYDVGRIAGELQHFFMKEWGDKFAAEPFVNHFLHQYSRHFPDSYGAFLSITKRVPFHMAIALLRIARNSWISPPYRHRLIQEALTTLSMPT